MKRSKLLIMMLCLPLLTITAVNAKPVSQPQQLIATTSSEIGSVLKNSESATGINSDYLFKPVNDILAPHFDFEQISGLVIGNNWKDASAQQKQKFQNVFKDVFVRTYTNALRGLDDWEMISLSSDQAAGENDVVVSSIINKDGSPVNMDYRMKYDGESWKVHDVSINGISIVANLKSSFKRLVESSSIDELIAYLEKTNSETRSS